jgi:hypothetical protein
LKDLIPQVGLTIETGGEHPFEGGYLVPVVIAAMRESSQSGK